MKYQFTTEGSKPQTKYHKVNIVSTKNGDVLYSAWVSTPLNDNELIEVLNDRMSLTELPMEVEVGLTERSANGHTIIGLDSICRIISNIKPLKQKVEVTICGESKVYELDADKVETLLKSLE